MEEFQRAKYELVKQIEVKMERCNELERVLRKEVKTSERIKHGIHVVEKQMSKEMAEEARNQEERMH